MQNPLQKKKSLSTRFLDLFSEFRAKLESLKSMMKEAEVQREQITAKMEELDADLKANEILTDEMKAMQDQLESFLSPVKSIPVTGAKENDKED